MPTQVTIVILNWNGKGFLEKFLPSVLATEYPDIHILLADNASTDDSVEFVRTTYPTIEVLELEENYGFAEGNNRALPHVKTPYYVLLNSDVEVTPDWLGPLVELMDSDENIASIQPKIRAFHAKDNFEYAGASGGYMDALGYPFCRGRIFDVTEPDTGQYDSIEQIGWATGACCLIRKSVTDRIGLFEERYFAHMEEIDFCWRARNFGYKIMVEPQSVVYHVGGGTLKKTNPRKTYLNARNSLITMFKNFPFWQMIWKVYVRLWLDGVWAARSLTRGEFAIIWAIAKSHWAVFFSLPYWWKRRRQIYKELDQFPKPGKGYFADSAIWWHFVKGIKKFSDLPKELFR